MVGTDLLGDALQLEGRAPSHTTISSTVIGRLFILIGRVGQTNVEPRSVLYDEAYVGQHKSLSLAVGAKANAKLVTTTDRHRDDL